MSLYNLDVVVGGCFEFFCVCVCVYTFVNTITFFVQLFMHTPSQFFVLLVFLTVTVGVGQLNDLSDDSQDFIDESDDNHDDDPDVPDTPNLFSLSRAGCGFLIFLTFPVVLHELIVITVRFLKPNIIINYIIIYLIVVSATYKYLVSTYFTELSRPQAFDCGFENTCTVKPVYSAWLHGHCLRQPHGHSQLYFPLYKPTCLVL